MYLKCNTPVLNFICVFVFLWQDMLKRWWTTLFLFQTDRRIWVQYKWLHLWVRTIASFQQMYGCRMSVTCNYATELQKQSRKHVPRNMTRLTFDQFQMPGSRWDPVEPVSFSFSTSYQSWSASRWCSRIWLGSSWEDEGHVLIRDLLLLAHPHGLAQVGCQDVFTLQQKRSTHHNIRQKASGRLTDCFKVVFYLFFSELNIQWSQLLLVDLLTQMLHCHSNCNPTDQTCCFSQWGRNFASLM